MKSKSTSRLVRQNRFSIAMTIPKYIVKKMGLNKGDTVTCRLSKNKLIIEKLSEKPEDW